MRFKYIKYGIINATGGIFNMQVLNHKNSLLFNGDRLIVDIYDELFLYRFEEINRIAILTTQQRLVNETVFLVFDVIDNVYLVGLTHPDFDRVLLHELNEIIDVDHNLIIEAMQNKTDRQYVLYRKQGE